MATKTVVTHVCDKCGNDGVETWRVARGNRVIRTVELCVECSEPLAELVGSRKVGLKKPRVVTTEESLKRRKSSRK